MDGEYCDMAGLPSWPRGRKVIQETASACHLIGKATVWQALVASSDMIK